MNFSLETIEIGFLRALGCHVNSQIEISILEHLYGWEASYTGDYQGLSVLSALFSPLKI